MLRIRFFRIGKKNQPFFRIVVTDKRNPPQGGRFLEILGNFDPFTKETNLKPERIKYWLSVGAQPSNRVHNLLVENSVIEGQKRNVHKKKEEKEIPEEKTEKKSLKEEKKDLKEENKETSNQKKEEKKEEDPKEEKELK